MKKVTILNQEYNLEFNMGTAIMYQRSTGKNIVHEIAQIQEQLEQNDMSTMAEIAYIELAANNENVPEMMDVYRGFKSDKDAGEFLSAAAVELFNYYMPAVGDKTEDEPTDNAEEGAQEKHS